MREYLIAAVDDEDEAIEYAEHADAGVFERASMDSGADEDLNWEDFEGLHKVAPVSRWLVDWGLLECGFAQQLSYLRRCDMPSKKEVAAFVRLLQSQGWEATRTGGGHWKLVHPRTKGMVFASYSPSDPRALANTRAQGKRALKRRNGG